MKSKIFKTSVSKLHFPLALFILINLITGYYNLYVSYNTALVKIHFLTGIMIIGGPLIILLTINNKKAALKAFLRLATSFRGDFINKKYLSAIRKLTASGAFILIILSLLTGIMLKFNIISYSSAYKIHTLDFKLLLGIIPIHLLLGIYFINLKKSSQHKSKTTRV